MIGYLSFVKDNGKRCWIRADEVSAYSENESKVGGAQVPCLTILVRNNVSWSIPHLTGDELLEMMKGVTGAPVQVLRDDARGGVA